MPHEVPERPGKRGEGTGQDVRDQDVRFRGLRAAKRIGDRRRRHDIEMIGHPVAVRILPSRLQGLRIDVDGKAPPGPERERRDAEDPGAASVVDHELPREVQARETPEAKTGARMGAGTEREPRIEPHHHPRPRLGRGLRPRGADPEPPAEPRRLESLPPRANPVRVGKAAHPGGLQDLGGKAAGKPPDPVHPGREETPDADPSPERPIGRPGFEARLLPRVLEGDRDRSGRRERLLDRGRAVAGTLQGDADPAAGIGTVHPPRPDYRASLRSR